MRQITEKEVRDFTGSPVVKPPCSKAGGASLKPGWGTKIPHTFGPAKKKKKKKKVNDIS